MTLPSARQGSLPAGWLAFAGRELNPLDRNERFQITCSSPFPGLTLTLHPPFPATCPTGWLPPDSLLRLPRQRPTRRQSRALPPVAQCPANHSQFTVGGRSRQRRSAELHQRLHLSRLRRHHAADRSRATLT